MSNGSSPLWFPFSFFLPFCVLSSFQFFFFLSFVLFACCLILFYFDSIYCKQKEYGIIPTAIQDPSISSLWLFLYFVSGTIIAIKEFFYNIISWIITHCRQFSFSLLFSCVEIFCKYVFVVKVADVSFGLFWQNITQHLEMRVSITEHIPEKKFCTNEKRLCKIKYSDPSCIQCLLFIQMHAPMHQSTMLETFLQYNLSIWVI